jgi:hypothetical protein
MIRKNTRKNRLSTHVQLESMERRDLFAAHIVGSSTSYATIQAAVNAASAGATINVDAGTYTEQVTINKPLTLRGVNAGVDARTRSGTGETILTGVKVSGGVTWAVKIAASNVTLDGFTIQGQTTQATDTSAGVIISPSVAGTHFLDNIVQNNVAGLYLANNSATNAAVIQYNVFKNNNNAGANGGRGIYTDGSLTGGNLTNVTIDSNLFQNNRGGSGTTGLESAVAFEAQTAGKQSNFRITNNTFTSNGKSLLFFNTTGVIIEGNTASGAADWYSGSLRFEGNNHDVTIEYNNIINNPGPGVAVDSNGVPGDNSGFVVSYNNITGNGTNYSKPLGVVYNQSVYDGTFDASNNWWGNANGPSGDGPGTGNAVYGNASKTGSWNFATGGLEIFSPWSTTQNPTTAPSLPAPPANLTATPASNTQINLAWVGGSGNPTQIKIERSLDNLNFTQIATTSGTATTYTDMGLSTGTKYYYRIRATNVAGDSIYSNVASATTTGVSSNVYLSDLPWASATAGYGTVTRDASIAGNPLTIGANSYAKGIGTHAVSTIVYNLGGQYSTFQSDVGIDAEEDFKGTGSVDFQVIGDGKTLYDSGVLTNDQVGHINISIAGVQTLTLKAINGVANSIDYDHADWGGAVLTGTPAVPAAPANLVAIALSSTQMNLTWNVGAANVASYVIDRSTDGKNFITVATGINGSATSWTDPATLTANTTYYYQIRAVNAVGQSPNSNIASATTLAGAVTYISDLPWTSATAGWGTPQTDATVVGNTITLRGQTYAKGIGTHAFSTITYQLNGNYSTFLADIGVDDEAKGTGSVDFQVVGDNGVVLYDSGVLTSNSPIVSINVNVTGVQTLTLIAKNGVPNDIDYDHADWANARLVANA